MDDVEVALRCEAARRRLAGESPAAVAVDLGRTRQWVAKWAARYDPHDPGWAEGRSRAPRHVQRRTPEDVRAVVLEVRGRLEKNPWAQVGAPAVAWELEKLGVPAVPLRTIERIMQRGQVTGPPAACQAGLQGHRVPGSGRQRAGRCRPGGPRRSAPSRRRGALPRAQPD